MSVIQSFKARQLKKQVEQKEQVAKTIDKNARDQKENEQENIALSLLAKLLNVAEQDAVSTATKYVESNITFFMKDKENGELSENAEAVNQAASDVESAASDVESSAENVNKAASNVEDAASDLAYSTSDIVSATEELKEAANDIKKPSVGAQKSSNGEKASKQKKSSKK